MKSEAFLHYTDVTLTLTGLILFVAMFVSVLIWTGLKGNQKRYRKIEQIPFHDGGFHE